MSAYIQCNIYIVNLVNNISINVVGLNWQGQSVQIFFSKMQTPFFK
jgi:hypothetical protein